jgi:hypothetical protein
MLEWALSFTSGIYATTTTSPCDAAAEEGIVVAVPAKC